MKIPFDIKFRPQIESGEYKVETKDGRGVRIVCWDAKRTYNDCICGLMGEEEDHPVFWQLNGCWWADSSPSLYDLFIVTPDPELSEWQTLISACLQKHGLLDCSAADRIAKECSAELLDLAKKELTCQGNIVLSIEDFEKHYVEAQEKGRKDDLKDLPKWKKYREAFGLALIPYALFNDGLYNLQSGYSISFSDLEKLPKED